MPSKTLIAVGLLGLVLIGLLVAISSRTETKVLSNQLYEPNARIVFSCEDESEFVNICAINTDGTGFSQITDISKENAPSTLTGNYVPNANSLGQIVFMCQTHSQHDICIINLDGTGLTNLTNDRSDQVFNAIPSINESGQIYYACTFLSESKSEICSILADGTSKQQRTEGEHVYSDPSQNELGQVVFECTRDTKEDICIQDDPGAEIVQLTSIEASERSELDDPDINNQGQIVYSCQRDDSYDICVMTLADRISVNLTANTSHRINEYPVINDHGTIAYLCGDRGSATHICAIEFDGSGFRQVTRDLGLENIGSGTAISETGLIAFSCSDTAEGTSSDICVIKNDGSNFKILTQSNKDGGRYFNPDFVE